VKVTTTYDGPGAVVHIEGRLDAEWAGHLAGALDELLRAGVRSAVVDLSRVSYVSSAGARVVITSVQEFAALRGELLVATPPRIVADALGNAGLDDRVVTLGDGNADGQILIAEALEARARPTRDWRTPVTATSRGSYETVPAEAGAALTCQLCGDAERVARGEMKDGDCEVVSFPERVFGIGIGALGDDYEQCGPRMGELLGVGGVVAFQPTDGGRIPDYLTTLRDHVPSAMLASGIVCEGSFSHLVRFSAKHSSDSVPLSELASVCLAAAGSTSVGVVMIVETAGLVGASRRVSPASDGGAQRFDVTSLREWLTFTAEPAHIGATALIAGVIDQTGEPPLRSHVRPLDAAGRLLGHLHAAVFSYQPVARRTVPMNRVVESLFAKETLQAVLHLLPDSRHGAHRESRFARGLAWAGRLETTTVSAR
jgi:anti-anti-sigma factor